jgi:hypothetical protein
VTPGLADKLASGWQIVRLPFIDGQLEGFLFKQPGDLVKQGEVLAFAESWWGLCFIEFVATMDGRVGFWMPEAGYLGIEPPPEPEERHGDVAVLRDDGR